MTRMTPASTLARRMTVDEHLEVAAASDKDSWAERYHLAAAQAEALCQIALALDLIAERLPWPTPSPEPDASRDAARQAVSNVATD